MGPNRKEAAAELILLFQVHDPSPRRWPWGQDSSSSAYRQVTLLSARVRRGTGREGKPGRPSAHTGEETARRGASRLLAATGTPAGRGQGPGPARGSGERQGGPESRGAPLSFPPPARPSCRVTPGEHGRGLGARGPGLDLAFRGRARPRPRASRRWRDRAAARGGRSPDFDRGSEVKAPSVLNDHPKPRKRDGVAGFPSRDRGQASSWPLGACRRSARLGSWKREAEGQRGLGVGAPAAGGLIGNPWATPAGTFGPGVGANAAPPDAAAVAHRKAGGRARGGVPADVWRRPE